MLFGYVLRSQAAAGFIVSIDVERATASPGVRAVLVGGDIPDLDLGLFVQDEPLLARDQVRYSGEPVALIAAETYEEARAAALLIELRIEELPPVLSIPEALGSHARLVRGDHANITEESRISRGAVEEAFKAAHHIVETDVVTHRVHQAYIEPRAALAEFVDGNLIVHTSSQAPFEVRHHLSRLMGMPLTRIVVTVPALGGGFGGKLHLGLAGYASVLSQATGRPVMVVATRDEEMRSPAPRENSAIRLTSAVAADGTITARRAQIYMDSGAYAYDTPPIAAVAAMQAAGPYRIEALDIIGYAVYTNTVPTGSFRAPSGPQMAYAVEMHMNDIAEAIGDAPGAVRWRNALRAGDRGPTGQVIVDEAFTTILGKGLAVLDAWSSEIPELGADERRGVGLGCAWWTVSPIGGAVTLSMNEDATFVLNTGGVEIGTGAVSVALRDIVAEFLGLESDAVLVVSGGTDSGPYDHGSQGSRTLYGLGTATSRAADSVRQLLIDEYAREREVSPLDVVLSSGAAHVVGDDETRTPLSVICAGVMARTGPVVSHGRFKTEGPAYDAGCVSGWVGAFNEPTFHCHIADITVDMRSGAIRVNKIMAIHDVGEVLNLAGAHGQVEGGVLQGVGYALMEEIMVDDSGRTRNANLHDYHVPTMVDVPADVVVELVTEFSTSQAYRGIKGVGEAPVIPVAAAIGSALRDAIGAQPGQLPMNPERVLRMVESAAVSEVRP
jgi:CO/xanthine dehydrogenase Mo-binding subunit